MKRRNTDDILAAAIAAAILNVEQEAKGKETEADTRKQSKILGDTMYQSMLGFMDAGFSLEQSFELVKAVIVGGGR